MQLPGRVRWRSAALAIALVGPALLAGLAHAQTNPAAQSLPYSQNFSSLTPATVTAMPAGWAPWQIGTTAGSTYRTTAPTADKTLTASGTANSATGATYNYLDKPGNLNSGSFDGALALAINTTALQNIVVGYDIMTIRNPYNPPSNTMISLTTIQYRVGTTGAFTTLDAASYFNNTTTQTGPTTTGQNVQARSITLPAACNNQPVVQVRWVSRDSTGSGARPSMAIDNVSVTASPLTYTLTASAGANGSIAPPGVTTVNSGANQTYTITPNAGYLVQDVLVDGGSVGAVTSYSFNSVSANHTISASFVANPNATVSAVSPGTFVTTTSNATVPVTLTRALTTPILGFSVTLQLTGLTTTSGAITEGGFLSASGASTSFQVVDNGGGSYTVDGVTLGLPCGSSATSGTLFSLSVGSALTGGSGTVTLTSVTLRDCSNATLGSTIGTAATVSVDRSTPSVAVTSPNGGESWLAGSSHAITWTATDAEGIAASGITLEYSVNNGANWLPVASGLANSGSFSWTVPANPSTTALVRATAVDIHANTASDASNAVFTIQGTSSTSLSSTPNPSVVGQSVTLTATVTPASATGSVEFFDGATSLGTATLSGGSAALGTSSLAAGPHSLTAVYGGSVATAGSTSAAHAHTVNPASTTTSLASSPDPSVVGQSVALTATVSVVSPGTGSPGGSVEFFDGATSLGTAPVSAGSAVLNTAGLAVGAHSLTAVYAGNASFSGSTSAADAHTVNPASTTTSLASSPDPSVVGQSVALTATVSVNSPGAGSPGGSVQFFDGATSLGTAPVSAGSAVLNTAGLAVGAHSLTAVYAGNASFSGSTSAADAHTVNPASTTTSLVSSPDPSVVGQSVALTASVSVNSPGAGSPGGSVQFFDGATSLGTAPVSAGSAVLNTAGLTVGAHSLTAVYAGNASFSGSTSAADAHTVNPASTATSLTSAPNPSTFGANATLTATVSVSPPGAGSPTGSVEFFDGATSLGTAPVSAGSAALNTAALAVGGHSLTAVYSGAPSFSGSTSAVHPHSVSAASSSTTVSSSPNPSVVGQSVTVTATITPASATGSVQFFDGLASLGTAPVSAGSASISTASLAVGAHSITAVYSGDPSFGSSTSPAQPHTVNPASTTTSLASSPDPSVVGQSVALTATVSVVSPGAGSPGGSVQFFDGATSLGTAPVSAGSAVLNTAGLAVGAHSLTAVYAGNASFSGSTSAADAHTVNPASTATSLTSAPNPSTFGANATLTATVSVSPPGAGSPTGSVEFFDGATSLGTAPVSAGSAALNTAALAVGAHSLTAVYSGAPSFSGSTSAAHAHNVSSASTTTAVTTSPNPSVVGQGVTISATVTPPAATGTVEFFDGATSLGSSPLSAGVATLGTSSLAPGSHSITAVYSGSPTHTTSTSPVHAHVVDPASTTTSLASSPDPSVVGQSVALTATVSVNSPGAGSPGGSVQFFDGATSLGTAPVSAGSAVLNTAGLAVGAHSLTAVYSGNASFSGSTSAADAHTVNPASTATSLASAPNPSTFGASVTLTATVSVSPPGAGSPGGSVQFFDGATSLGTSPVSGGTASISTAALAVGGHSLTAVYSGNASFSGSTSAVQPHTVNQASTSTSLASAPNPSTFGTSVTLTATVTPSGATGTVQFFDGASSLGTSPVSGGTASLSTSALSVGAHSLTAVYSGDASYTGSASAAHSHTVNVAGSSTVVTTSPNPSVVGQSVSVTATVTPSSATGTVQFFDGATSLGTSPVSGGTASLGTSALALGSHSITAVYSGDLTHTGSTSPVHAHTVNQASTSTSVASTPNPSVVGQSVTVTATVSVSPPGAGSPGGSVQFFDGATSLGTSPVSGGTASISTAALAVGGHSLTAVYSGNASFSGSTSAAQPHTVNQASTSTSVASAPNPSTFGASVTLTATVSVSPPGAGSPGGSVQFFDGATSLGTSPVSGGTASISTAALAVGGHSLTAVYSGNASFSGSTSAVQPHTVNAASSSTSLASAPNPSTFGTSVTFTATVTPSGATGTVQFFDGATSLGTSLLVSGVATLSTSALAGGSHPITAVYSGNASYTGSTSNLVTQVVNAASSSVTLAAAPDPGVYQDPVTLTATVTPSGATGSVQFFDGASSLGTSPVSGGTAQLITSSLPVGVHSLTAQYLGDASHSGSTSAVKSLEVKAKIVATAGANGSIVPSGTTLYSLNATPSYTFAANPGHHVASVTVDGSAAALTSPYTFAPVSSNHTIDVQFAANPAVPAIATLSATQVRTGNDGDGNTKITLAWAAVPVGSTVEVWRKGYGNYPEYDDGPTPGSVPATPGAYPPAGWTLTSVTTPGGTDEPGSRDFWYYVAYVTDGFGTRSTVSNQTTGTLSYHLGDVSDGATPGLSDNQVTTSDLSVLGAHYGITGAAVDPFGYLDVGPTTDLSVNARPTTDNKVNFEDLVMFALNYFPVTSAPQAHAAPAAASRDALALGAPPAVRAGEDVAVRVSFTGTGRVLALSTRLAWDPAVVQPVSFTAGDEVLEQGALLLSATPGTVDGAMFAGSRRGFTGEGEFATLHFKVVAAGDPKFGFASVDARDAQNKAVALETGVAAVTPRAFVTGLAPAMPNPFSRTTTFAFSLAKAGRADLEVFSVDGRRVRTITSGVRDAGEYRLAWNGADDAGRPIAPGVYYARLVTAQGRFTRVVTRLE